LPTVAIIVHKGAPAPAGRPARQETGTETGMSGNLDGRIRERAHLIWEREGRPQGRDLAHWHMARAEIAAEDTPARKAAQPKTETEPKAARAPKREAAVRASAPSRTRKPKA
jgi:hypothetical protein